MPWVVDRIISKAHNYVEELRKHPDGEVKIEEMRKKFQKKFKVY